MGDQPLVSICVPTYNYGRFISVCIESVLAQTFHNWELIIVDDCSTDNTSDVVGQYAAADQRIRYIRNETRLGMNGNIKKAAESGTGKYLKILCSDDWLAPNCLEVFSTFVDRDENVVLATSAEIASNEAGEPVQLQFLFGRPISVISGQKMIDRMARGEGFGGNSSFFIRASAYRTVGGYDPTCRYAADYDLAARLCREGDYLHIDEPLFYGRAQPNSSSAQDPKKLYDVVDWFEIPNRFFQPRRFGNREWRRYQLLTAKLTARYLVNIILQELRGDHSYAKNLRQLLMQHGNFALGIPMLVFHIPERIYERVIWKKKFQPTTPRDKTAFPCDK